ncbi:sensor histidine kinase [Herbidospora mongoliensis]|uniref:sensor histidine kinase n=1 Tax=Herbidospora mongoliensis TaxID=688067 RepID=UPI00082F9886|nr:sensor histidine kinase [Herbidospora mongoliensis]
MERRDVVHAAVAAVVQVVATQGAQWGQPDRTPLDWRGYLLLLVGPLMILWMRRLPVVPMVVTLVATWVYIWCGFPYGPAFVTPIIMIVYTLVSGHRRPAWIGGLATLAFMIAYTTWLIPAPSGVLHQAGIAAFLLLVMVFAEWIRAIRERRAENAQKAAEEERRQASEERLSMAQELHDVLAHNISLIHVQASTALHLIESHPEQARSALSTIKTASKDVLSEMRGVLDVLREGAPRNPTAGLDRLDDLVARSCLDVALTRTGEVRSVPHGPDRAAYRIVQESLTNVTRHAPGSRVEVELDYGENDLGITITDDGAGKTDAVTDLGGGNGIPGMRERASALGGSLTAGPFTPGFRVSATLPIPPKENP